MKNQGKKIRILEVEAKHALSKSGLPELDYALNPYLGCLHACLYCFAIDFTSHREARENWGNTIAVKINLLDVLKREIVSRRRGMVGVATITDPYQAIEGKYRLTRRSIKLLLENGFRVTVQTKSPLVTRDIDLFSGHRNSTDVGITVTSMDRKTSEIIEPGSPDPLARVNALERLVSEGVHTWMFVGPIMRGINDGTDNLSAVVTAAANSGTRIIFDKFQMYSGASSLIQKAGIDLSQLSNTHADSTWWKSTRTLIESICDKQGVQCTYQPEEWKFENSRNFGKLF